MDPKDAVISIESIQDGEIDVLSLDDAVAPASGKPDMPHQFNWISTLGISFSITNSWAGYLVSASARTLKAYAKSI